MPQALIGLGSNLGDRAANLDHAVQRLSESAGSRILAVSRWHPTAPIGGPPGQGEFLNGALRLQTSRSPTALLDVLLEIENSLGRARTGRWAARVVDLDLLLYGDLLVDEPRLRVPHPWLAVRRFVLLPAAEVAADLVHPAIGWTISRLLDHLEQAAPYFAVAGLAVADPGGVARQVAAAVGGRYLRDPQVRSAGQSPAAELELCHRRAMLLDHRDWTEMKSPVVSDFWLDQSLCVAPAGDSPQHYQELYRTYQRYQHRVIRPKLVVLLDAPPAWLASRHLRRQAMNEPAVSQAAIERLQTALLKRVKQPRQGPYLLLDAQDARRAASETTAAILAMRKTEP